VRLAGGRRSDGQAGDHYHHTGQTEDPAAGEQPASPGNDRDARQYDPDLKADRCRLEHEVTVIGVIALTLVKTDFIGQLAIDRR
jgi:hypothetical protein